MADKEVLSQEEIDALLDTVDSDENTQGEAGDASEQEKSDASESSPDNNQIGDTDNNEVRVLNFGNQERIVRGELPVLDKIHDRAAKLFANDIYQLMARDLEIKQEPLSIEKHREYMTKIQNPTLINIYRFRPLRGKAIILFDSTFVYDLVDYYFGGSSQFPAQTDRTDFTATELRVMDIFTKKLVHDIAKAWAPIIKIDVVKTGDETNPQLVHISEPDEMLLISRFTMAFGKETGSFSFVIPYSMVEPIKQQLELGASRPDEEIDPNWIKSLEEELMDVELTVSAAMAETDSTLRQVMQWQKNDFIPMQMKEEVTLDIENTPSFTVTLGNSKDKRALKIIKKIHY